MCVRVAGKDSGIVPVIAGKRLKTGIYICVIKRWREECTGNSIGEN